MSENLTPQRTPADAVEQARSRYPDLPRIGHVRWTPKSKQTVVHAIRSAHLTRGQAMAAWEIDREELAYWLRQYALHGRDGLASGKTQVWRRAHG